MTNIYNVLRNIPAPSLKKIKTEEGEKDFKKNGQGCGKQS
jgi:hypothetical protein